jgi:broad specificity phosphatase PhoE
MDKTIRRYTDIDEMKADEYRYWQSRPVHERLDTAAELSVIGYQWKEPTRDVQSRLQRTLVRVQRAPR